MEKVLDFEFSSNGVSYSFDIFLEGMGYAMDMFYYYANMENISHPFAKYKDPELAEELVDLIDPEEGAHHWYKHGVSGKALDLKYQMVAGSLFFLKTSRRKWPMAADLQTFDVKNILLQWFWFRILMCDTLIY